MTEEKLPIAVLGAGSWGTALALLLAENKQDVRLWSHEKAQVDILSKERENKKFLPGFKFPQEIQLFSELSEVMHGSVQDILIVVPSHVFADLLTKLKPYLHQQHCLAWGTKGLDPTSNKVLSQVVKAILGREPSMAVISGPSYAKEVVEKLPTAVALASNDEGFAKRLLQRLHNHYFRVYATKDMIGVQLCGALKNVMAIAAGMSDGLGYGANSRSALITRGIAEMARLLKAAGGKQSTLMGLAGIGDLVLTCTDDQSRNRRFGLALGVGKSIEQAQQAIGQVVEGLHNTEQIAKMAEYYQIEMPIVEQVHRVIHQQISPQQAVEALMERPPRKE